MNKLFSDVVSATPKFIAMAISGAVSLFASTPVTAHSMNPKCPNR